MIAPGKPFSMAAASFESRKPLHDCFPVVRRNRLAFAREQKNGSCDEAASSDRDPG
jgi:hypothetical protein